MAGPRVLIVEDEKELIAIMLRSLPKSWSIVAETDARVALQRLLDGERFDVVLLDLIMPDFSGILLFNELKAKKPELCEHVIFTTGGLLIPAIKEFLSSAKTNMVLEKPYYISEITQAVKKVMKGLRINKNGAPESKK